MKLYKKLIILACLIVFITLVILLKLNMLDSLDNTIYDALTIFKSKVFTKAIIFITFFGGMSITIILIILCLLINRKKGIYMIVNTGSILLINSIIKFIIARPRPEGIGIIEESWYSFPSAHAMNSVALYGLIIYYIFKTDKIRCKKGLITILLGLSIIVPLSRVYLGVHYFSDVLAGASLSTIWLLIFTSYLEKKSI